MALVEEARAAVAQPKDLERGWLSLKPLPMENVPPPEPGIPTVQNVVATCDIGCRVDLYRLARYLPMCSYAPDQFVALTMRLSLPSTNVVFERDHAHSSNEAAKYRRQNAGTTTTALVFDSGMLVVPGASTINGALFAAHCFLRHISTVPHAHILNGRLILAPLGHAMRLGVWNIRNVVGSMSLKMIGLDLELLDRDGCSKYKPDLFPGLTYKMRDPNATALYFDTGEVVVMGVRSYHDLEITGKRVWEKTRGHEDLSVPHDPRARNRHRKNKWCGVARNPLTAVAAILARNHAASGNWLVTGAAKRQKPAPGQDVSTTAYDDDDDDDDDDDGLGLDNDTLADAAADDALVIQLCG